MLSFAMASKPNVSPAISTQPPMDEALAGAVLSHHASFSVLVPAPFQAQGLNPGRINVRVRTLTWAGHPHMSRPFRLGAGLSLGRLAALGRLPSL